MSVTYYEKQTTPDGKVDYYRHFYRVTEHHLPVLNLVIAINRSTNTVSLEIEPNDFFNDKKIFSIFWKIKGGSDFGQFFYDGEGPLYNYEFAAEINKYLYLDFIEMNYFGIPLFDKRRADVFIQTYSDFHRLVSGEISF